MAQDAVMADHSQSALSADFQQNMNLGANEFDTLLGQVQANGHQPTKWRRLVDLAQGSGETEKIKAAYEALLAQYPNTAAAQISYIEHYLNQPPPSAEAEELFKRWVKSAPSVELFRFYLTYIRRIHADPTRRDPTKREIIRKAYEFALNPPHGIGQDKDSGDIWLDYIQFLSETETTTTWDSQQNMDALRKVYHRAVQIPLDNVERIWSDLEAFETKLNRITAKKFMADLTPAHMQARTTYRQLMIHVNGLYPPAVGTPELYLPTPPIFTLEDRTLVGKWKAYLKWEEGNPLEIEEKDRAFLILRLQTVYRKAVVRMRYYSEIWFMAYLWTKSVGKTEEAMTILRNGREANPLSHLLTYALVDSLEFAKQYTEAETVFDEFIKRMQVDLVEAEERIKVTSAISASKPLDDNAMDTRTATPSQDTDPSKVPPPDDPELNEKRQEFTLVYTNYMRFVKRTKGVAEARPIFKRARFDRFITWHVYEAAAMLEFHCTADKTVPGKIFASAYSKFGNEVEFVSRYMQYLFSVDDEQNARAVFEASTKSFAPDVARPIWERWAKYEFQYGDQEAALKLERRMAEVYPSDPPIKRFAMRQMHLGVDAIASRDIGFAMVRKNTGSSGLSRQDTVQSLTPTPTQNQGQGQTNGHGAGSGMKRPPSPEHRVKREEHTNKRIRANSPVRDRDSRWNEPRGRRYSPPPRREREREREESNNPKSVALPGVLHWFQGQLPPAAGFDGPIFRTDDLMNLFRGAVIPSSGGGSGNGSGSGINMPRSPPPPPRAGGRPPPDYSPYQGPGGGGRGGGGRRY